MPLSLRVQVVQPIATAGMAALLERLETQLERLAPLGRAVVADIRARLQTQGMGAMAVFPEVAVVAVAEV